MNHLLHHTQLTSPDCDIVQRIPACLNMSVMAATDAEDTAYLCMHGQSFATLFFCIVCIQLFKKIQLNKTKSTSNLLTNLYLLQVSNLNIFQSRSKRQEKDKRKKKISITVFPFILDSRPDQSIITKPIYNNIYNTINIHNKGHFDMLQLGKHRCNS